MSNQMIKSDIEAGREVGRGLFHDEAFYAYKEQGACHCETINNARGAQLDESTEENPGNQQEAFYETGVIGRPHRKNAISTTGQRIVLTTACNDGNKESNNAARIAGTRGMLVPVLFGIIVVMAAVIIVLSMTILFDHDDELMKPVYRIASRATMSPPEPPTTNSDGNGFVTGVGLAKIPIELVSFIESVVAKPARVGGRRELALPPDMLEALDGHCSALEDYRPARSTDESQCGQNKYNLNFPLPDDREGAGISYQPQDDVLNMLSSTTGATLESLREMNITNLASAPLGAWCGMPLPGWEQKQAGTMTPQEEIAYNYWLTCVTPRAGYFNALECKGSCDLDGGNCTTSAVLGFAAMQGGVCYPPHQHAAHEAYWQVAGRGWWRTWTSVSELQGKNFAYASNDNFGGSRYALHAHRSSIPHEFDTTSHHDNSDDPEEPMVMIYFWGSPSNVENNYQWASGVRDSDATFSFQESAASCGDTRRIPVYDGKSRKLPIISEQNC